MQSNAVKELVSPDYAGPAQRGNSSDDTFEEPWEVQ